MSKYDNIINLPHYELKNHKRMSIESRSAQFAPFAALTGYSDAVSETSRLTCKKIDISEDMKNYIDMKLQLVENHINEKPLVTIIYFEKDNKKSGGKYLEHTGNIKKIDMVSQTLKFTDGKIVELNNICDLSADFIRN